MVVLKDTVLDGFEGNSAFGGFLLFGDKPNGGWVGLFLSSVHVQECKDLQQKHRWVEKQPRGQPLYPYALVSVSIGFFLCIGLQCFGSSSSNVVTFPYKCSMRSTLCQLPAPAGKSQLFSTSVVRKVHFGSSSWKVATFQQYAQ